MRRRAGSGWVGAALVGAALAVGPFACSSSEPLQGAGGHCGSVNDCQDGLVCCDNAKGSFTCMASAACIQPMMGAGADAGMGTGTGNGASNDGGSNSSPQDAGTKGQDASMPETGSSPMDSGNGSPETGSTPEAAPPVDAGDDAAD